MLQVKMEKIVNIFVHNAAHKSGIDDFYWLILEYFYQFQIKTSLHKYVLIIITNLFFISSMLALDILSTNIARIIKPFFFFIIFNFLLGVWAFIHIMVFSTIKTLNFWANSSCICHLLTPLNRILLLFFFDYWRRNAHLIRFLNIYKYWSILIGFYCYFHWLLWILILIFLEFCLFSVCCSHSF